METSSPLHPATGISTKLYYQLICTLTQLFPPPLDDSPEALNTRNRAAIAKVAALLPVNANEADLAAQCIAARAQAEDILLLLRENAGDIRLVMRLNAQYGSMVRTSLSVHARLMRVQAARQKRETIDGAADADAWNRHVAERSMLRVADPDAEARAAQPPEAAPAASPDAALPADVGQWMEEFVSKEGTNSHYAAFETWLGMQFRRPVPEPPNGTRLHDLIREPRLADWESPVTGRPSPGRANQGGHRQRETASA
jgi:hypothetical protein